MLLHVLSRKFIRTVTQFFELYKKPSQFLFRFCLDTVFIYGLAIWVIFIKCQGLLCKEASSLPHIYSETEDIFPSQMKVLYNFKENGLLRSYFKPRLCTREIDTGFQWWKTLENASPFPQRAEQRARPSLAAVQATAGGCGTWTNLNSPCQWIRSLSFLY